MVEFSKVEHGSSAEVVSISPAMWTSVIVLALGICLIQL